MKKVYLDANVLLELLFHRARYEKVVKALLDAKDVQLCISVLSVDLVMYFVEIEKQSKVKAWEFLSKYHHLDLTTVDTTWAHDNDQGDFEDALQVSCALRHGCKLLITLDKDFQKMYGAFINVQTIR